MTTCINIQGPVAHVVFQPPFDTETYRRFLQAKQLPEKSVSYDWRTDTYTLTTASRFLDRLGIAKPRPAVSEGDLASFLFDYQSHFTARALEAQRWAQYWDCGLGKGPSTLEFGRQVVEITKGRFLHWAPAMVVPGLIKEAEKFYNGDLRIRRLHTRKDLEAFLEGDGDIETGICNYEKLDDGQLPGLRNMAGISCDESSFLKTGGGVRKWNMIHSARGIEYKLSCTATPAPNDAMEYASQCAFLETLRSEGDVLWTYFTRDEKTHEWDVKPHARVAFYEFMSGFSAYLRNPAAYGFRDNLQDIPAPQWFGHQLDTTPEQDHLALPIFARYNAGLFGDQRLDMVARNQLAQLACGFSYRADCRVASHKPAFTAELVRDELARGNQVIIWMRYDEEADILAPLLPPGSFEVLDGRVKKSADRESIIERTETGDTGVLLTKAGMMGFGRNMQQFGAMVFNSFDDSFERMYQAVRRAYRYGQTKSVRIHVPYVPILEGLTFENVRRKETDFLNDAAQMETVYRRALGLEGALN